VSIALNQSHSFYWKEEFEANHLYYGEIRVGRIVPFEMGDIRATDLITKVEEGIFEWKRRFSLIGDIPKRVRELPMEFEGNYQADYWMIPSVSYNGNSWGKGHEPKGWERDGQPWTFAFHRTSIPGATCSEGNGFSVSLFGKIHDNYRFSCSLQARADRTIHQLIWPEQEKPYVYAARDLYEAPYEEELVITGETVFEVTGYLIVNGIDTPKHSWNRLLDISWRLGYHHTEPDYSPEELWNLGIEFAREQLYVEDGIFKGFTWGLAWNKEEEKWKQKREAPYEIGWVGQNASLANSLLVDYLKNDNISSKEKGLSVLDCWAKYAPLKNGLFRVRFDHIIGKKAKYPEVNDACNLATTALQFFDAFNLAERCGEKRPKYLTIALNICNFAIEAQKDTGKWGKCWDNDGICKDDQGTIGAFLLLPLVRAYQITGEKKYLTAAKRGYQFYFDDFLANGYSTAGALDTYCIDKESSIPLIKGGLELYKITNDGKYLNAAELASYYAATWQWSYSIPLPKDSLLHQFQYDSFGGTSVSTQHHHIDHYALTLFESWNDLAELTGNQQWQQRAHAIWTNASRFISDGSLSIWGKKRPRGGQDEGICQTRWHTSMGRYFGVSQWLVAWPTAFRLEIIRNSSNWLKQDTKYY